MNPFDLPGPQFLFFYSLLTLVTLLVAILLTRSAEDGEFTRISLSDPYRIAYLRGGKNEALRVATLSLIDRGLLKVREDSLVTAHDHAADLVQRPIEKALLEKFAAPAQATAIFDDWNLAFVCADYESSLTQLGLLPGPAHKTMRQQRFVVVLIVLLGVAAIKIVVALMRGRHNVLFLLGMAIIAAILARKATYPFRTARGGALLVDLRTMCSRLKERRATILPGGTTSEAALLAAVYGLSMLPTDAFPYVRTLYPKTASSSGGWSCGTSCGSSCGGGDGGGCGGCGSG